MTIRLTGEARDCLLLSTQPGTLVHDVLSGAPVITRLGDAAGGLYEVDCSDADCQELMSVAAKHCPGALREIEAAIGGQSRG
jgi:hypothetical protein